MVFKNNDKRFDEPFIKFLFATQSVSIKEIYAGGHYKAIWLRDASFILKDQFLAGYFKSALYHIFLIWCNQIGTKNFSTLQNYSRLKKGSLLYGRGSPELGFKTSIADDNIINKFEGALPTTIYYEKGFCEVYGQNPDIDSTALMIYVTSWILSNLIEIKYNDKTRYTKTERKENAFENGKDEKIFSNISLKDIIDFLIPRMFKAVQFLQSRDRDNDGLLEQKHNEDWMDTLQRTGKVVYSQSCWILALKTLSFLLKKVGNESELKEIERITKRTIIAVEEKMWSAKDKCYIDQLKADQYLDEKMYNRFVTQDICLYLVALTECDPTLYIKDPKTTDRKNNQNEYKIVDSNTIGRALDSLDTLKNRIWKNNLPLVTEKEVIKTGPWSLKPYQYHNYTFWSWFTGIEMVARKRFDKTDDFNYLMSLFVSKNGKIHWNMLYEWVNPLNFHGYGAYPFRTGISSIRMAAIEYQISCHPQKYQRLKHIMENL